VARLYAINLPLNYLFNQNNQNAPDLRQFGMVDIQGNPGAGNPIGNNAFIMVAGGATLAVGVSGALLTGDAYTVAWVESWLSGTAREGLVRWWANKLPETLSGNARTLPASALEQTALEAAKAGSCSRIIGNLGDPRLQVGFWEKFRYILSQDGVTAKVHYVSEALTGIVKDFKFK
jgi:hypothetical protein